MLSKGENNKCIKLVIRINIFMCIVLAILIFIPIFIAPMFLNKSDDFKVVYVALGALVPMILYLITWIVCIVAIFNKKIEKYKRDAYMLMPIYYMFVTLPAFLGLFYIINKLGLV